MVRNLSRPWGCDVDPGFVVHLDQTCDDFSKYRLRYPYRIKKGVALRYSNAL